MHICTDGQKSQKPNTSSGPQDERQRHKNTVKRLASLLHGEACSCKLLDSVYLSTANLWHAMDHMSMYFTKANCRSLLNYLVEGVMVSNSKCYHYNQTHMLKQLQSLLILLSWTHQRYCTMKLHTHFKQKHIVK